MLASLFCDMALEFCDAVSDAVRGASDTYFPTPAAPRRYYRPVLDTTTTSMWYSLFEEVENYFEQVVKPTLKSAIDMTSWKFQKSYHLNALMNIERVHAAAQCSLERADCYGSQREVWNEIKNMNNVLARMIKIACKIIVALEADDDTFHLTFKLQPIFNRLKYYKAQLNCNR